MKKIQNIIIGWWFWITNQYRFIAQDRLKVCAKCIHRKGFLCGLCGCVLQAKARLIDEKCPANKWKK